jgi:glycosyltransferase involved in cell wall biosynthesis
VVNFPVKEIEPEKIDLDIPTDFNFLCVAQWGPRKNLDKTIRWFVEEFHNNENVGLVLKTQKAKNCLIDRRYCASALKNLLSRYPDHQCKVYLLHGAMSEGELTSVYTHPKIKAIVSTTHGEGFGLPLFEAAYNGLPVIATNWSGHRDFLSAPTKDKKTKKTNYKPLFGKVDFVLEDLAPEDVWENVLIPESKWAAPKEASFKSHLSRIYKDHGRYKAQANKLKKFLKEKLSKENQYQKFVDALDVDSTSVEDIKVYG